MISSDTVRSLSSPPVGSWRKSQKKQRSGSGERIESAVATRDGLFVVDQDFHIVALDSGAEDLLADFRRQSGTTQPGIQLPPEILDFLSTRAEDVFDVEVLNIGDREYRCRVVLVKPVRADLKPMLMVSIKQELSVTDFVLHAASAYHLTDREREALVGVTMGLTSKELAVRMDISPNTVKAFLRLVMIKMGAPTRAAVVGKLLGPNPGAEARSIRR